MKKIKPILVLLPLLFILSAAALAAPPEVSAETAVVMDANTGQILYEKKMHQQMFPASITKILTTILAVENLELDDKIVMSAEAVDAVARDAAHIALVEDEVLTVEEAVHAALLASANDACNGIAEAVSGSMEEFAAFMTQSAGEMGCLGTNFTNSNGLKDENHYTTAYDMAKITQYGLKNESWREMFGCRRYEMPPNDKQKETRYFNNQHKMIFEKKDYYEGIVGGKTGYTSVAKNTLVTVAERDGRELIVVVMKCPKSANTYEDTRALLDYGFEEFDEVTITPGELPETTEDGIKIKIEETISVLLPKGAEKSTGRIDETEIGTTLLFSDENGEVIGMMPIEVEKEQVLKEETVEEEEGISFFDVVFTVIVCILILFALFIAFVYIRNQIHYSRYKKRKAAQRRKKI